MTGPKPVPAPLWAHFLGGPVPYDDGPASAAYPRPSRRRPGPPPVLSPEEFNETPLTPEQRARRAAMLVKLRQMNHPRR